MNEPNPIQENLQAANAPSPADDQQTETERLINGIGKKGVELLYDFINEKLPPREYIIDRLLPKKSYSLIYAEAGIGKSFFVLKMLLSIASGTPFLKWDCVNKKGSRVLYIDGEMAAEDLQERLKMLSSSLPNEKHLKNFKMLSRDRMFSKQGINLPDFSTPEMLEYIKQLSADCDVIVFDNIATLYTSGDASSDADWRPIQSQILALKNLGKSVIFIHHASKGGDQRGTSARRDMADLVIKLERPQAAKQDENAFNVIFNSPQGKARHLKGSEKRTLKVTIDEDDGAFNWEYATTDIKERNQEIVKMYGAGVKQQEIADKYGLSRKTVNLIIKDNKHL